MNWLESTFGYDSEDWSRAKEQLRRRLIGAAAQEETVPYSELADAITAIRNPKGKGWHYALNYLLGQVAVEEYRKHGAVLSAVAVYKDEMAPGPGFDSVVRELGLGPDPLEVWVIQLKRSYEVYGGEGRIEPSSK